MKIIFLIPIFYLLAIAQSGLATKFPLLMEIINIPLWTVIITNLLESQKKFSGITCAFFGGLFLDFYSKRFFGFYALTFCIIAILIKLFVKKNVRIPFGKR